jgi:hypothetical protein
MSTTTSSTETTGEQTEFGVYLERIRESIDIGSVVEPHQRSFTAFANLTTQRSNHSTPTRTIQYTAWISR